MNIQGILGGLYYKKVVKYSKGTETYYLAKTEED